MAVWVVLLRGINLGARNKVNMPALRAALEGAGFQDVRTYVQSGNVVARSRHRSADAVGKAVRAVVRQHFDLDVAVVIRTPKQLRDVVAWCPFPDADRNPTLVHVVHLPDKPKAAAVKELLAGDWSPDAVAAKGNEIVVRYSETMHASKLQRSALFKQVAGAGTARNWRTLMALLELTEDA